MSTRCYSEVISFENFYDRFAYLKLGGVVGCETFGSKRYLNQVLYRSPEWKEFRRRVILRDNGMDLAHPDYCIVGTIYVHHINPITIDDILDRRSCVFDMENAISVSFDTHEAIHYRREILVRGEFATRYENDTSPWR